MFPDIRLLIAATFASVAALICGFGIFATVHVSNEPLVRLPPAAVPPQHLAENSAAAPMAFAAAEPFERRFQLNGPEPPGDAVASLLRMLERRQGSDQGIQSAVDPSPAAPDDGAATVDPVTASDAPAEAAPISPVAAAAEEPAADEPATATPTVSEGTLAASEPEAAPTAVSTAEMPPESTDLPQIAEPDAGSPAAVAPSAAAVESPAEQAAPAVPDTTRTAIAPATITTPAAKREHAASPHKTETAAPKKPKHKRAVPKNYRQRGGAVAAAQSSGPVGTQTSAFQQPSFQTAPQFQQAQLSDQRQPKARRAKVAAGKSKELNTAVGGPFVSAPTR
jgi:hypothetical protein